MVLEIRSIKSEELEEFKRQILIAFLPPQHDGPDISPQPEWTLCGFVGGKLTSTYAAWPLIMQVNGKSLPCAGVTLIGTLPEYRRRGQLRKITKKHFENLHETGEQSLATLWAAHAEIYQRYDYRVVTTANSYEIEPRYIKFTNPLKVPGVCRSSGKDEFKAINETYFRFIGQRTGYLLRNEVMWDAAEFAVPPKGDLLDTVVYEEDGKILGYVIYVTYRHPQQVRYKPYQQVTIRDMAWLTPQAYQSLWEHFSSLDLARNVVWWRAPTDEPLPHLLQEPRMLNHNSYDGLLGRLIDVKKALPGRGYSKEGNLKFEVIDDFCPWNTGRWKLETSPEGASIKKTSAKPDLSVPISTLGMLYFGQISATQAARMGQLDVHNYSALSDWDAIMQTAYKPSCPEIF